MEREEWAKAINDLENIGPMPDKFLPVASNILFFLYVSRNQYEKINRVCERFDFAKSKDCISALLLFRDKHLDYTVNLPKSWSLDALENAIESHAQANLFESTELHLCLYFLSLLDRSKLLVALHAKFVATGGKLDNESIEVVLRSLLKSKMFEPARSFLWFNNLNGIDYPRFSFLIDRAEKSASAIPDSTDKFIGFLRYKFGAELPEPLAHFKL